MPAAFTESPYVPLTVVTRGSGVESLPMRAVAVVDAAARESRARWAAPVLRNLRKIAVGEPHGIVVLDKLGEAARVGACGIAE